MGAHAAACESPPGHVVLGTYQPKSDGSAPVILEIRPNDIDIEVRVERASAQVTRYSSPGGRNGPQWIYLPAAPSAAKVCIYATYQQRTADAYSIAPVDVSRRDVLQINALRVLSDAAALWAADTQTARTTAVDLYQQAARQALLDRSLSEHAQLYAALAQMQRYQYDSALQALRSLLQGRPDSTYVQYAAHWAIGSLLNRKADFAASAAALETALAIAGESNGKGGLAPRRDIAEITNLLGEVKLSGGDIAGGERLIRQSLAQSGDDAQLLGMIHNNLGYVYLLQANAATGARRSDLLGRSIEQHFRARDYAQRAGDLREQSIIENNLGTLLERTGDLRRAREHYERALHLVDSMDDPLRLKILYRALGAAYLTLGDYAKSERFLAAAIQIAERSEPGEATRMHCQLGTAQRLMGRLPDAVAQHAICHSRAQKAGDDRVQAEALHELTIDYLEQGRNDQAWKAISEAAALLPQVRDGDARSKVLVQQARVLQSRGDDAAARTSAREAVTAAASARYPTARVEALAASMTVHAAQNRTAEAISFGGQAIEAIESIHAQLDAERLGPAWSGRTDDVYVGLAELLIADYNTKHDVKSLLAALDVVERSRAISLRQQFAAPTAVLRQVENSPALDTLTEIANTEAFSNDADGLPLSYYHEHDLLTLSRLAGAGDLPVPRPLGGEEIQKSLAEGQVALCYFVATDRIVLFVLSRTKLDFIDLGSKKEIYELAARFSDAVTKRSDRQVQALRDLSMRLLPQRATRQRAHTWIVSPGEGLHGIPFNALHVGSAGGEYQPAMSLYAIRRVPSLSAYLMQRSRRSVEYAADLALFADPAFRATEGTRSSAALMVSSRQQRLPWTAKEAEQLRGLFPPRRTLVYVGSEATRDNLRSLPVRNSRVLHIASHGYFRASSPDNVGFALAAVSRPRVDSGFVTLTELFTYRFNNELVVISGCETAMGEERGGEGLMSLTRGFIAQGASHVMSTLWPVSDRASADFMGLFYKELVSRGSVGEALRAAQVELSRRPQYSDPFFWAPYVLTTVAPDDRMTF